MNTESSVPALPRLTLVVGIIFTFLVGGLSGLLAISLVLALLYFCGGWDSASKHGISENQSCRLGGVILVVYPICALVFHWLAGNQMMFSHAGVLLAILSLGIFALGLYEDLTSALSARRRLLLMLAGAVALIVLVPELAVQPLGLPVVDWFLGQTLFSYPLTVLALAFLPNAFNVADGANGLLSGISLLAILGLMNVAPELQIWPLEVLFTGCMIFFALNVLTGRLFLGDGGAYLLGLIVGITLILTANQTEVSPWFLAMLVFYPIADFLFSIVRRLVAGRSAMSADNEHFHNLLFRRLKSAGVRSAIANTLAGVSIALLWSGTAVLLESLGANVNWFLMYGLSWLLFVALWLAMKYMEGQSVHALPRV